MIVSYLGTKGGTGTTTLAVNGAADVRRLTGIVANAYGANLRNAA